MSGNQLVGPDLARERTAQHLRAAVQMLESQFGEGYARERPELVGALVQACALEDVALNAGDIGHVIAAALRP